jgi:hypothetical protein
MFAFDAKAVLVYYCEMFRGSRSERVQHLLFVSFSYEVTSFILGLGMIIGEQAMYSAGRENGRILCVAT